TMRLSLTAATPLALGALLVLSGCTAGGDAGAEPTDEATSSAEATAEESAEPEEDAEASGGAGCLEGTWNTDVAAVA
ncbi:hypothetical protein ACQUZK_10485, partial [Streptococcus pyogenes]|uniref:hypothetical protein n=1 Tax=Streptococcus pyogenes TaxID=1314 RepID=UPI003D9FB4F7